MVILGGGNFLKADAVKDGDKVKFVDEGAWVENTQYTYDDGKPKQDFLIGVSLNDEAGSYTFRLNKKNRDALSKAWGSDTAKWIGNACPVVVKDIEVAGKDYKAIRVQPEEVEWDA
jgi:hypothetical protein